MAFNGLGRATLNAGEKARYYVDRGGDFGANAIGAHPELGINLQLVASEQTKVIEASFGVAEYQHFVYYVTIECRQGGTTSYGNPPVPADTVATFSFQGGGYV